MSAGGTNQPTSSRVNSVCLSVYLSVVLCCLCAGVLLDVMCCGLCVCVLLCSGVVWYTGMVHVLCYASVCQVLVRSRALLSSCRRCIVDDVVGGCVVDGFAH